MRFEYSAGIFIYKKESGKRLFLFLKRDDGRLDIPKGHIEKGEKAYDAAIRETREETGMVPEVKPFFRQSYKYFFYEGKVKVLKSLTVFLGEVRKGDDKVRISKEHTGYVWLDYNDAMLKASYKDTKELIKAADEYASRIDAMDALNEEYARLSEKRGWGLSARFVKGEGPLDAKIMIIGQAPGANEDAQQRPFVGRSGQLLESMLRRAGMRREKVYITSVVQFFPPKNRQPTEGEIRECLPFLRRQIAIIAPKYVLLLGDTAGNALLGIGDVNKNHGKIFERDGIKFMLTFHPAAALRLKRLEHELLSDFRRFASISKEKNKQYK
ncbi:MAG: uracil-DNA glycosylase family protein [Candidatus Micrarchaeaceae archaeon]